ncbi:MAG: galactokinase [Phycisphaerae bacterium]|nr:galactokinase [Phycisphaerae bacterium]MCZ2398243.1 galactokinase [Phycisphaerae bacterium]
MSPSALRSAFVARYGRPAARAARAPGRVNLIGEHTDYNDGFVLPIAIEQSLWAVAAPRHDDALRVYSDALRDLQTWTLADGPHADAPRWTRYVHGVATLLRRRMPSLDGADLLITGDLPLGGGLSSSAALEGCTALVLCGLAGCELPLEELAAICRSAEHEFAGVPCGLMDQYASLLSRQGCALLLDCRSRRFEHVPCRLDQHALLVVDSGVRHELASGEYAARRRECGEALKLLRRACPRAAALRDVAPADVARCAADESLRRDAGAMRLLARARHVVTENERTLAAAAALRAEDWPELGRLMSASHASLRDDYQVSCAQLDALVERLERCPGVLGARMTGGGFGGCVVALVEVPHAQGLVAQLNCGGDPAAPRPVLRVVPAGGAERCAL